MLIYNEIQSRSTVTLVYSTKSILDPESYINKPDPKLGWYIDGNKLDDYVMSMEEMEACNKLLKENENCKHGISKRYCKNGCSK